MRYWWVNHKQTFKKELGEGYIWSPKTKKGGVFNQYYHNLTLAKTDDIIFSFAHGEIKAIGLVKRKASTSKKPDFGSVGARWDDDGWLVPIHWQLLKSPFVPKTIIDKIKPLLPIKYSPLKPNGNGNECYLTEINEELAELIIRHIETSNSNLRAILSDISIIIEEDNEEDRIASQEIPITEKEQLIKARVGQGKFRMKVEEKECRCRLTGTADKRFLIASHIKPWKDSNDKEKLDGDNGLLLSPHVDKLFDNGYISFSDEGDILCASEEIKDLMYEWGLNPDKNVGGFDDRQKIYMKYHRDNLLTKKQESLK